MKNILIGIAGNILTFGCIFYIFLVLASLSEKEEQLSAIWAGLVFSGIIASAALLVVSAVLIGIREEKRGDRSVQWL